MPDNSPASSKPTAKPEAPTKVSDKARKELDEQDLNKVTGGTSDFTISKRSDKASP